MRAAADRLVCPGSRLLSCARANTSATFLPAKLAGCILVPIVDQREYLAKFPAAFEQVEGGALWWAARVAAGLLCY